MLFNGVIGMTALLLDPARDREQWDNTGTIRTSSKGATFVLDLPLAPVALAA